MFDTLDLPPLTGYQQESPQPADQPEGGSGDYVMFLSDPDVACNLQAKISPTKYYKRIADGFERSSYPLIGWWTVGAGLDMSSLDAVYESLQVMETANEVIIRGAPLEAPRGQVRRNGQVFRPVKRRWVCIDIDDYEVSTPFIPGEDMHTDRAILQQLVRDCLPEDWHHAGFVAQWSAGAGFTQDNGLYYPGPTTQVKVHLWFLLFNGVEDHQLRKYFKKNAPMVDPATTVTVQPHYVRTPIIPAGQDPVPQRLLQVPGVERVILDNAIRAMEDEERRLMEERERRVREARVTLPELDGTRLCEYGRAALSSAADSILKLTGTERHAAIRLSAQLLAGLAMDPRTKVTEKGIRAALLSACPDTKWRDANRAIDWGLAHPIDRTADLVSAGMDREAAPRASRSKRLTPKDLVNKRYLPAIDIEQPVCLLRGPQGVGKPYWLQQTGLPQLREPHPGARVVCLTHRRSMATQGSHKLLLPDYRDTKGPIKGGDVAICVDSLHRIAWDWDSDEQFIILLDESEQVIRHLARGGTMNAEKRLVAHNAWRSLFARAAAVVAMDADLSMLTVEELDEVAGHLGPCAEKAQLIRVDVPLRYQYELCHEKDRLIANIVSRYLEGKKVAVACQSRAEADTIAALLQDLNSKRKVGLITSRTLLTEEGMRANANPSDYADDCDALVYSPSWGTAISVEAWGYAIYGIGCLGVGTASDLVQQLHRVRFPETNVVQVYLPRGGSQEMPTVDEIQHECLMKGNWTRQLISRYIPGVVLRDRVELTDQQMSDRFARVTVQQKRLGGDNGQLALAFKDLIARRRGQLRVIEQEPIEAPIDVATAKDEAKETAKRKWSEDVCSSPVIDEPIQEPESYEEQCSQAKYDLSRFYGTEVTPELVLQDKGGLLRRKLRQFSDVQLAVQGNHWQLAAADTPSADSGAITHCSHRTLRASIMHSGMQAAGLVRDGWVPDAVMDEAMLETWLNAQLGTLKTLGMEYKAESSPARWMSGILRRMGLKLVSKRVRVRGKQVRRYHICLDSLDNAKMLSKNYHETAVQRRLPENIVVEQNNC